MFTKDQRDQVAAMQRSTNLYTNLAISLAPAVFGHEDVKKALLLMLFGGVHKQTLEVCVGGATCPG